MTSEQLSGLSAWASTASALVAVFSAFYTYKYVKLTHQLLTSSNQTAEEEDKRRLREHFLSGISTIAQYDINSPGCEQSMRLLDYYSRTALDEETGELLLLLNTVMTSEIRKKIEYIQEHEQEVYVYAVAARVRIQAILKKQHMERKGLIAKP